MTTKQTLNLIVFFITLALIPFSLFFYTLFDVITISVIFIFFLWLGQPVFNSLFFALILTAIPISIMKRKFIFETSETMADSWVFAFHLQRIIERYHKKGEQGHLSREITIKDNTYRVVRLHTGGLEFKKRTLGKLAGYIVINLKSGDIVKDKNELRKVLKIFKLWYYMYAHHVLGEFATSENALKSYLSLNNNSKKLVEKNRSDNYQTLLKKYDAEYVDILRRLDYEVLLQNPIINKKINLEIGILRRLYQIFRNPSEKLYEEVMTDLEEISKLSCEENKIWNKRLSTWKDLSDYEKKRVEKIPKFSITNIIFAVSAEVVNLVFFNSLGFGSTIIFCLVEPLKWIYKKLANLFVSNILQNELGIKAINKNIEVNKNIKKVLDDYENILEEKDIKFVRF